MDRETYEVMSFYQPRRPRDMEVTPAQERLIEDVAHLHRKLGHPGDHALTALIEAHPEVEATVEGLKLWRSVDGACSGCVQGKMAPHAKLPSTTRMAEPGHYEVGEAAGGDIYYLEKKPYFLLVDIASGFMCDDPIVGHTLGDLNDPDIAGSVGCRRKDPQSPQIRQRVSAGDRLTLSLRGARHQTGAHDGRTAPAARRKGHRHPVGPNACTTSL